jgi:hypothetical protein
MNNIHKICHLAHFNLAVSFVYIVQEVREKLQRILKFY